MLNTALQIAAILLTGCYPIYSSFRSKWSLASFSLYAVLWLVSALSLCDFILVAYAQNFSFVGSISLYCMALLCPFSLLVSKSLYRDFTFRGLPTGQYLLLLVSCTPLLLLIIFPISRFYFSPDFLVEKVLFLESITFFFYLQVILILAFSVFNLEATIVNAPHGIKWKIKFMVVGLGTILTSCIFYYSQGIIYRAIDIGFAGSRSFGIVIGVILMMYSTVKRGGGEHIIIPKRLAYRSFVVLFSALFLLSVGLIGEGVKLFGEQFDSYVFAMIAIAAGVGFIIISLSERVRRRVRLAIQKNFYGEKYDYRVEWKKFTDRMMNAQSKEELCKNILTVYCETFGIKGSCIFLKERHSSDFTPVYFHEMTESAFIFRQDSKCVKSMKVRPRILDLRSETLDLDADMQHFLTERSSHFILPIHSAKEVIGLVILGPPINIGEIYDAEDMELMHAISRLSAAVLTNLRLGDALAEARDMEAFGKVAAFMLHDLKNQVYPLSLLEKNARKHINDPEFQDDMLNSLSNIVCRMNELIAQLTHIPSKSSLKLESANLLEIVKDVAQSFPEVAIDIVGDDVEVAIDVEEFKKVVLNLYLNAMESGDGKPFQVVVENEESPSLKVIDFGKGIDKELLEGGLFVPFKTTKKRGMGIGLYQSKQIIDAHGGQIVAASPDDGGAVFRVILPSSLI